MSQMEPMSSQSRSIMPDLNGHFHCDYEGNIRPEYVSQAHYISNGRKKTKDRLNDQLIPKPTDINMAEKMIKIAITKEHPYSSHISRFAMFPSCHSPGVRATYQPFPNHPTPNCAPDITLKSKTFGGPYRHEILTSSTNSRKKTREHGFFDGEKEVFCPTPPKTVLSNRKPQDLDFSLSEQTSNMSKHMERTHWVTSYQMHYTEYARANLLKTDDLKEKMSEPTGVNSHTATLRQRSYPVFVSSKSNQACRRREGSPVRSTCSATAAGFLNPSLALKKDTATATPKQPRPQEITAQHNEAPDLNPKGHSQSGNSTGSRDAQTAELSQEDSHKLQAESTLKNSTVWFDKSPVKVCMSQNDQEGNTVLMADTEKHLGLHNHPLSHRDLSREKSPNELCDEPCIKKPEFEVEERNLSNHSQPTAVKELLHFNTCKLPWPAVLPGISPEDRTGTMGGENVDQSLLELQNSFSKSSVHRRFKNSITYADVNLRDNVVTGRKHNFYGINSYYLHG